MLFKYWQNAHRGDDLPAPECIDPLAFPTASLPYLVIEEYEADARRFRTRLTGTAYRDAVGHDGTNLRTDEMPGGCAAADRLRWIAETRRPYWYRGPMVFSTKPWTSFSVLSLPFGHRHAPLSRVLCVFDFQPG